MRAQLMTMVVNHVDICDWPLELVEVLVSGQECILNRILRVGRIAQVPIGLRVKRRQAARENVVHFAILLFADADFEARFASDVCLCRLHFVCASTTGKARRSPINREVN
jgi:hypothetical protein